jgi:hypothetical protein
MMYHSEEMGQFAEALANAQGSYKKLIPNEVSAGGNYANLDAILEATKEARKENGLGFLQWTELKDEGNGASLLWTMLTHKSGQWAKSCIRIIEGGTDRANDVRNETRRRQQASRLLGIAPTRNDPGMLDDNGESQAEDAVIEDLKRVAHDELPTQKSHYETITKAQYDDLMIELGGYKEIAKEIQDYYRVESIATLPATEYHKTLQKIRVLKERYKEYMKRMNQ